MVSMSPHLDKKPKTSRHLEQTERGERNLRTSMKTAGDFKIGAENGPYLFLILVANCQQHNEVIHAHLPRRRASGDETSCRRGWTVIGYAIPIGVILSCISCALVFSISLVWIRVCISNFLNLSYFFGLQTSATKPASAPHLPVMFKKV